jgi:hypothetical protein
MQYICVDVYLFITQLKFPYSLKLCKSGNSMKKKTSGRFFQIPFLNPVKY